MAIRIFLESMQRVSHPYPVSRLNLWGPARRHAHSTSAKVEDVSKKSFEEMPDLSFEEFKRTKVKSFEEFKKSPYVQGLFNGDITGNIEKVSQAYEDYCRLKFNRYRLVQYGGNPATMI